MAFPVYSRRLIHLRNIQGNELLVNPGPNKYVIKTFTVYNASSLASDVFFADEDGSVLLAASNAGPFGGDNFFSYVWTQLHIVWEAGLEWQVVTSSLQGWDVNAFGYELF